MAYSSSAASSAAEWRSAMKEPESVDPDAQMDQRYVDLKLTE
jgi:hypothetical protein